MVNYYHITYNENVPSILQEGLKPRAFLQGRGVFLSELEKSLGYWPGNPAFVYLYGMFDIASRKKIEMRYERTALLGLNVPPEIQVQRDDEQILIWFRHKPEDLIRHCGTSDLTQLVKLLFKQHFGIHFLGQVSEEEVTKQINAIPEKIWEQRCSSYKTKSPIPPEFIEVIDF